MELTFCGECQLLFWFRFISVKFRMNFVQNVILYLFKSRDKLNTLTEVLSVETANRRERHPGDSPQATDFKNKRIVQKNCVDSAGKDLNGTENFRILKKRF